MKSTLIIAMLLTLTACISEKKSSHSCTYNGGPCPSETEPYTENQEVVVVAEVTSAIYVDGRQITVLENNHVKPEIQKNGRIYQCENSTDTSFRGSYRIAQDKLVLISDVQTDRGNEIQMETYTRVPGPGEKLIGTWKGRKFINKDLYHITFLTFGEKSVKSVVECHHQL